MRNLLRSEQPGTVLAGVKATPCGWPTASPDPGCGGAERRPAEQIERKQSKIHPTQSLRFEGIAGFRNIRAKSVLPARAPKPTRPGPGRPPGSRNHRPAPRYDVGKTVKRDRTITARQQRTG
jgi:hypothetical protein